MLVDFSVDKACLQLAQLGSTTPDRISSFLFGDGVELMFEAGDISVDELHQKFESTFNVQVSRRQIAVASSDIFSLLPDSVSLLQALRQSFSGPIILLSNTNVLHWEFITSQWPIIDLFDHLILSFEARCLKPSPKIFQLAIETAKHAPENCFFTDDLAENIAGARAVGLDAVQFSSAAQIREALEQRGFRV